METLAAAARTHGIRVLVAFGSQVSGRTHAASDLDLGVVLDHPSNVDLLRLIDDLQAAFDRTVDIVLLDHADPLIRWAALRAPQLLVGDARELSRAQLYAWRRYVEYQPFFDLEAAAVRRAIAGLRHGH